MSLKSYRALGKDVVGANSNNTPTYLDTLIRAIESDEEVITFLHNTQTRNIAEKIVSEGFEFQSYLDYTTDVVSARDIVTIKYFTIVRQSYGKFTIIIQISKQLIEEYADKLENIAHHFSEILTVKKPYKGPEDDLIYCLAPHFIKGFVDTESKKFYANPNFNSSLKIPVFEENLKKILS